ncbi:MAG: GAF domain-containing protein [Calditrichota bacterium]
MPPNLDVTPEPGQFADLNSFYDKVLDTFYGLACRLDGDGRIAQVSASWEELANRTGRPELARNEVLGKSLWDLLADEQIRGELRTSLTALAHGRTGQMSQMVDFSAPHKPFFLSVLAHAVRDTEEHCTGFIVQGIDVTTEHLSRAAILERERKLRDLRAELEKQKSASETLETQLSELRDGDVELQERIEALESDNNSLKEQLSATDDSTGELQERIHELQAENAALQAQLSEHGDSSGELQEQLNVAATERTTLQQQLAEVTAQREALQQQNETLQSRGRVLSEQVAELEAQIARHQAGQRALVDESNTLKNVIANLEEESEALKAEIAELEQASHQPPPPPPTAEPITPTVENDVIVLEVLETFRQSPDTFADGLCRLGTEYGGAMFATFATYRPEVRNLVFTAEHQAPEFHKYAVENHVVEMELGEGPAGIAAEKGCPTKFDHLLKRDDFAKWAPLAKQNGYNCIWAFPLADDDGLYGVLQLYYSEVDFAISIEPYAQLTRLCQLATPLLRLWQEQPPVTAGPELVSEPVAEPMHNGSKPDGFRMIAADLAEEFGNLLTGVLGHSSLAAAEMGQSHAAIEDVRAIERSARGAARLTRKLSALCGANHKNTAAVNLTSFLKTYTRDRVDFFPAGAAGVALPDEPCLVHMENTTLELVLDGIAEHARAATAGSSAPTWTLNADSEWSSLILSYEGGAELPEWWDTGEVPAHGRAQLPELVFVREAVRAHGGELTVAEDGSVTALRLTLPLVQKKVAASAAS